MLMSRFCAIAISAAALLFGLASAAAAPAVPTGKLHGIIIAVNEYSGRMEMQYTKVDIRKAAAHMEDALTKYAALANLEMGHIFILGGEKTGNNPLTIMTDAGPAVIKKNSNPIRDEPNEENIIALLNWFKDGNEQKVKVQKNDTFVFYYTGHAETVNNENMPEVHLHKSGPRDDARKTIAVKTLLSRLAALKAGHTLVFFDSCRNPAVADEIPHWNISDTVSVAWKDQQVMVALSAEKGERATVNRAMKMGYFTEHLTAALSGATTTGYEPGKSEIWARLNKHLLEKYLTAKLEVSFDELNEGRENPLPVQVPKFLGDSLELYDERATNPDYPVVVHDLNSLVSTRTAPFKLDEIYRKDISEVFGQHMVPVGSRSLYHRIQKWPEPTQSTYRNFAEQFDVVFNMPPSTFKTDAVCKTDTIKSFIDKSWESIKPDGYAYSGRKHIFLLPRLVKLSKSATWRLRYIFLKISVDLAGDAVTDCRAEEIADKAALFIKHNKKRPNASADDWAENFIQALYGFAPTLPTRKIYVSCFLYTYENMEDFDLAVEQRNNSGDSIDANIMNFSILFPETLAKELKSIAPIKSHFIVPFGFERITEDCLSKLARTHLSKDLKLTRDDLFRIGANSYKRDDFDVVFQGALENKNVSVNAVDLTFALNKYQWGDKKPSLSISQSTLTDTVEKQAKHAARKLAKDWDQIVRRLK